jgi:hypothetical protein
MGTIPVEQIFKTSIIKGLAVAAGCLFAVGPLGAQEDFKIQIFRDTESGGWAYKSSDDAFRVEIKDCHIQWNAVQPKDGKRYLRVRRTCTEPFRQQAPIHRAILKKIHNRWRLGEFETLCWGPFCRGDDWDWCLPIAEASLHSAPYIEYWQNYPDSQVKSVNGLFVSIANETHAYAELAKLFAEFDVVLRLQSVEKVFSVRLQEAPFGARLRRSGIKGNPRIMYDAGMTYFSIEQPE